MPSAFNPAAVVWRRARNLHYLRCRGEIHNLKKPWLMAMKCRMMQEVLGFVERSPSTYILTPSNCCLYSWSLRFMCMLYLQSHKFNAGMAWK